MIKRYDISDRDLKLYPQYYKFIEKENGRFIKWEDLSEEIKKQLLATNKEINNVY